MADPLKYTQFNFRLSDGTVIPAGINPSQAATIDVGRIMADPKQTANPDVIPQQIIDQQKSIYAAKPPTPTPLGTNFISDANYTPSAQTNPTLFGAPPPAVGNDPATGLPLAQPAASSAMVNPNQNPTNSLANVSPTNPTGFISQAPSTPTYPGLTSEKPPTSTYAGPSIVDYLGSVGQPSDYGYRSTLAASKGITNYTGTAEQNTQLLNMMRGGTQPPSTSSSISSGNIAGTEPANFSSPSYSSFSSISGLGGTSGTQNTNQQNQQGGLSQDLQEFQKLFDNTMGLNNDLVGEGAYQSQQDIAFGVAEKQKIQKELEAQLNALIAEEKAIPMQIQQDATGRGVTDAGIRPLETAALRNNSIRALGVSSMLEASRGNLTLAQEQANKAVEAKYGPIKAQIEANMNNINLILNSPKYTEAEKARAQAQLEIQQKKDLEVKRGEEDMRTIQSWAAAALVNGASTYQAQQILDVAKSGDLSKAFKLYAPYAQDPNATEQAIADLNYKRAQTASINANTAQTNEETKNINNPSAKELSVDQAKARQFAVAAENADKVLNSGKYTVGMWESKDLWNILKSSDRQEFEQASRAFVNATLRRESGATITDAEFLNKQKELIPQAGDKKGVIEQKAAARAAAVETIKQAGLLGSASSDQYAPYRSQVPQGQILIERNGQIGSVPPNEVLSTDKRL